MKVDFEYNPDDFVAFITVHNLRSPAIQRQRYGAILSGFLFLLALPGLILLMADDPVLETVKNTWPLLLVPVLYLLFIIPYLRRRVASIQKRVTKQMLSEGQNSAFDGPGSLAIEPDGLRETTPAGETTRRWSAVEKVLVTDTHAFIYVSAVEAFILPRRAFETTAAFQRFVDEMSERAGVAQELA